MWDWGFVVFLMNFQMPFEKFQSADYLHFYAFCKIRAQIVYNAIVQKLLIRECPVWAWFIIMKKTIISRKTAVPGWKLAKLCIFLKNAFFNRFSAFSRWKINQTDFISAHFKGFSILYNFPIERETIRCLLWELQTKNQKKAHFCNIYCYKKKETKFQLLLFWF